jgi:hypothetical protein
MNLLKMTFRLQPVILLLILLLPVDCRAGAEQEVDHLLQSIEDSQCVFVRNGKHYSSSEARQHLQKKYNYIKRWVKKAEDFISYAASKSSISGKPYTIICDGNEMLSSEWFKEKLDVFRKEKDGVGKLRQ